MNTKRQTWIALLAAIVFASSLSAADPRLALSGDDRIEIEAGWGKQVTIANADKVGVTVSNDNDDIIAFDRLMNDDPAVMLFKVSAHPRLARPGATYKISLFVNGEKSPLRTKQITVVIAGEPVPPGPTPPPTPPAPADPLLGAMQAAFAADATTPDKLTVAKKLAAVYRASTTSTVYDTSLTTVQELYDVMSIALGKASPLPNLQPCREVIAAELRAKIKATTQTPLTKEYRDAVAVQYARMGKLLEALQ